MKYKAGQLVINKKLGIGKVLEVHGDIVTAYFKDQAENPRRINVSTVPMKIAKEQTTSEFDDFHSAKRSKKGWTIKRKTRIGGTPKPKRTK